MFRAGQVVTYRELWAVRGDDRVAECPSSDWGVPTLVDGWQDVHT